ncbi:MAG: glycosyltransferase family 39 protein [Anaerolineae bacterium]|nr:glycosyltransferase family 39 protein [Anaerolineae bacterium]
MCQKPRRKEKPFLTIIQLCLLFSLLLLGARQLSLTYDEPSHLAAGYAYLARGLKGMWTIPLRGHPLLVNAWEAIPLYIGNPNLPLETLKGWGTHRGDYAEAFIHTVGPLENSEMGGRVYASLLTLLLAAVVYRWAKDLWGYRAGTLALVLLTFDPTLLAHGRLATNDAGVTMLGTLYLYLNWRWLNTLSWKSTILTGVLAGLTILAKGSGILWTAAGGILMVWRVVGVWRNEKREARSNKTANDESFSFLLPTPYSQTLLWQSLAIVGIAFLLLWSMYGFTTGPLSNENPIPVPAPLHWQGILLQTHSADTRQAFILGQTSRGQCWWYFPFTFLLKNPLPFLVGIALAIWILFRKSYKMTGESYCGKWTTASMPLKREGFVLLLFPVFYAIIAIAFGPNLGYRHILPVHPFLYLLMTGAAHSLFHTSRPKFTHHASRFTGNHRLLYILLLWLIFGTLRIFPYELTFFNELIGGPTNGWRYLSDSNVDWRHGYKAIYAWQEDLGHPIYCHSSTGYTTPADYGVQCIPDPPLTKTRLFYPDLYFYPQPGDHIINVKDLREDKNAWFLAHKPDAIIANIYFYYHIEPLSTPWLAQCTVPAAPLNADAIQVGFADLVPHELYFDCTQTWVYPNGGQTTGWYALHDQLLGSTTRWDRLYLRPVLPADAFTTRHLAPTLQAFRQGDYQSVPAFVLYEWETRKQETIVSPIPTNTSAYPARVEAVPATLTTAMPSPITLDGPLTFLGTTTYREQEDNILEVETWWQVAEDAPQRTFSLMAHALNSDGVPLEVADGLGISPLMLQQGDILVQRHRFSVATSHGDLWLRTGVYWLDDGSRCSVSDKDADAIFVPLEVIP